MRVTIKGQVTVPKALRERFGITRDTEVQFIAERGKLVLVKRQPAGTKGFMLRARAEDVNGRLRRFTAPARASRSAH